MKGRISAVVFLGVTAGWACCGVVHAESACGRVVSAADMVKHGLYGESEIPEAIVLGGGRELSLPHSADTESEIVEWADKHGGLLYMRHDVVVAINVAPEKGAWALLDYTGPKPWKLSAVAAVVVPAGMTVSSAEYGDDTDSLVVISNTGKLVASVPLGRKPADSISPARRRQPTEPLKKTPCQYRYPQVPSLLYVGHSAEPLLPAATTRAEIVQWARAHDSLAIQSAASGHFIVTWNRVFSSSGIYVTEVYVRTEPARRDSKPWKLACVGIVSTGGSEAAGMYVDEEGGALALLNAWGDKIGMLELGELAIHGER